MSLKSLHLGLVASMVVMTGVAHAAPQVIYSNGFESDLAGWTAFGGSFNPTRVASGTAGVTSSGGGFHAVSQSNTNGNVGTAGNWGGYNFGAGGGVATAFQSYRTQIDVFLDTSAGLANDTRFNFSSAISNASGNFGRDFAFNFGFYNDATGPGAGTNRFVVSASTNAGRSSSFPKNPGRNPFAISDSGWYTLQHLFYDNAGTLAVDLNILDSTSTLLNSWTLSDPTDLISAVGGNRYGWFVGNEVPGLALDNASLSLERASDVPEPATLALVGLALAGAAGASRRRKA